MISVILPVHNEEPWIESTLKKITHANEVKEIIVVDGSSTDKTVELAQTHAKVILTKKGKAHQLNTGAQNAQGDILFFAHADMTIPETAFQEIQNRINSGYDGGGFSNVFDRHNEKIKKLGRLLNFRLLTKKESADRCIFFGDNGIFVKKSVFQTLGGFKDIPIMEDYDFSLKMKNQFKVTQITNPPLILSARRHETAGFLKTRLQWILIKRLYQLGIPPKWLARLYQDIR